MRQPTPTLPITSKMLRHFAVVTVAMTACIGIFAQGENAEVAAKPKQVAAAPQEESGGGFLDFGGAERRALTSGGKDPREVNGMKLASETRLNAGGDDGGGGGGGGDGGGGGGSGEATGYFQPTGPSIRTVQPGPAMRVPAVGQDSGLSPPAGPAPIPKDSHGVPAPGAATATGNAAPSAKPQPPRRPSQQDIERMMAASSLRSGQATAD